MDLPNNNVTSWPPWCVPPPSPLPTIPSVSDELVTHDFIIKCINKQKHCENGKHDEANKTILSCSDTSNNNYAPHFPLKKRARLNHTRRNKNGPLYFPGILRNCTSHI